MYVMINPGSGPVRGACLRDAWRSIRSFRRELYDLIGDEERIKLSRCNDNDERDGRYSFRLALGKRKCLVEMPGLPPEQLKASTLTAPRLYIDGSSWWWQYALSSAADDLAGEGWWEP